MGAIKWPIRVNDPPFADTIYDADDKRICLTMNSHAAELVSAANRGHEADNATASLQAIAFTLGMSPSDIEGATCDTLHEWIDAKLEEIIPSAAKSEGDPRLSEVREALKKQKVNLGLIVSLRLQADESWSIKKGIFEKRLIAKGMNLSELAKWVADIHNPDASTIAAIRRRLADDDTGEELAFFEGLLTRKESK